MLERAPRTSLTVLPKLAAVSAIVALVGACAMTRERLPELDRRFYDVMESPQRKEAFLVKDPESRRAVLERAGLWDRWMELSEQEREAALAGQIEPGFQEFAVLMAWGPPADAQNRERAGNRAVVYTFIRCTSGPRRGKYVKSNLACDGTASETKVALVDDVVVELSFPD